MVIIFFHDYGVHHTEIFLVAINIDDLGMFGASHIHVARQLVDLHNEARVHH